LYGELERVWKEADMADYPGICLEELKEIMKDVIHDRFCENV